MYKISRWYNNYQAPLVLMIDDLSDAYIDVYKESYKNDWGYLTTEKHSAYDFLKTNLLKYFPDIKITFFVPYMKHNVINEYSNYSIKKHALGDRDKYTNFLKFLVSNGHEIAHHGSNHGKYINEKKPTTINNWTHEWALFKDIKSGVETTKKGIDLFKSSANIQIIGGKYCGYVYLQNSKDIIDQCNFLYWCEFSTFNPNKYKELHFGKNEVFSFPSTFAGNSFVRLSYKTGNITKDFKKMFFKYFQFFYNILSYYRLNHLYSNQNIISIQEHISPSTTAGTVQSANIVSDIKSLKKIFTYFQHKSIWYQTCAEISKYEYIYTHSSIEVYDKILNINFNNKKCLTNTFISITNNRKFTIKNNDNTYTSIFENNLYVVNLLIVHGKNTFTIEEEE